MTCKMTRDNTKKAIGELTSVYGFVEQTYKLAIRISMMYASNNTPLPLPSLFVIRGIDMTCYSTIALNYDYAFMLTSNPLSTITQVILYNMSSTANELSPQDLGGMKRRSSSFSQRVQVKGASIKVCLHLHTYLDRVYLES